MGRDSVQSKEFFASFDFSILDAPTKRERTVVEKLVLLSKPSRASLESYQTHSSAETRARRSVRVSEGGGRWRPSRSPIGCVSIFMERNAQLLSPSGRTGVVVPSAFHANEGATGVRTLYMERMALECCYSFENRRKLFEIHSSFKFATVVARNGGPRLSSRVRFIFMTTHGCFQLGRNRSPLIYSLEFVEGPRRRVSQSPRAQDTDGRECGILDVVESCFENGRLFGEVCRELQIRLGSELHMTNDAWRFTPASRVVSPVVDVREPSVREELVADGFLVLYEGKSFRPV